MPVAGRTESAAVGVSRVKELGFKRHAMPTNGNAGAVVANAVARNEWVDVATLKEPYRIVGSPENGLP